jgi:predicted 3-demethylubiquinone-9 3-methyltransferase (glyoxalase superfamily)
MTKISVNLWFDRRAAEAARFYTSVFAAPEIKGTSHYGETGKEIHGQEAGTVMTVEFELDGLPFTALNGGPQFKFNPSISFFANCGSAVEVEEVWARLSQGGRALMPLDVYPFSRQYGWVEDRYGVSWQVMLPEGEPKARFIPSLLFVGSKCGKAEEAIDFYTSVFQNARKGTVARYGPDQEPDQEGTVMHAEFELAGRWFAAMDSAQVHDFDFNEATSFIIHCGGQAEVDYFWDRLSADPAAEQCGWLKDRYGVSWQVVPTILYELMQDRDRKRAERVMTAMLQMKKLDIRGLEKA